MVTLDLADVLTIDPGGDGHHGRRAVRRRRARPTAATSSPGRCALAGRTRRACTSTSASPTAAGSAAARPTPPRCCAGPASTTSASPSRLGADVPFCLVGGRARVRGIGEVVEPLARVEPLVVTLVVPPLRVSTPAVYRAWDELGGPTADGPNDLEPAALAVEPRAGARGATASATLAGVAPVLAGSGATWFVRGRARRRPRRLAERGRCGGRGPNAASATAVGLSRRAATCGAGGGCAGASSCASSCASACGAS